MKLRPTNKRLTATLYEEPHKGALILTAKDTRKDTFVVVDVCENDQGIKAGDRILVDKFDALEKEVGGEKVYIIEVARVVGVIE